MPSRLSEAEATKRALKLAERFQRMFLRTLRGLRDLRRYTPTITIMINIGQQQMNLASG